MRGRRVKRGSGQGDCPGGVLDARRTSCSRRSLSRSFLLRSILEGKQVGIEIEIVRWIIICVSYIDKLWKGESSLNFSSFCLTYKLFLIHFV